MQQDSDKHSSRLCQNERENLQSPDLIPVELVWGESGRKVKAKQPISALHMGNASGVT